MKDNILVVVPCYNAIKYIEEAVATIKEQTASGWKCVIVDDGSTDGSSELIDRLIRRDRRFKAYHTENRGVAAARNLGIASEDYRYVLPFDADDRLMPQALERFMDYWKENPDASLLIPQIHKFGEIREHVQKRSWYGYRDLRVRCSPTNSSCFKKEDWERVGGYRHGTMYEDWEFWLRLLYKNDNVVNIPEVLVEYRSHPDSRWHDAVKRHNEEYEIIRKMNPLIFKDNA